MLPDRWILAHVPPAAAAAGHGATGRRLFCQPLLKLLRPLGLYQLILETEATGAIAFPFSSEHGTMKVVDQKQAQEIISVDLIPIVRNFCTDHLNDPECRNVADFDGDGDVDNDDLNRLLAELNTPVSNSTCGAPCDLNVDGVIDALDARQLVVLYTRPHCATQ